MKAGNVMIFGGFQGSIELSMEDNCMFGRILNIKDVVTYEAQTPAALQFQFRSAVLDYLDFAKPNELKQLLPMAVKAHDELVLQVHIMKVALIKAGYSL